MRASRLLAILSIILSLFFATGCSTGPPPTFTTAELDDYEARFLTPKLIKAENWVTRVDLVEKAPSRTGKVLLMVPKEFSEFTEPKNEAHVHSAQAELPEKDRATPGQVDTVIFCRPEKAIRGEYRSGNGVATANALRWETEIYCFEAANGTYLGRKLILGEEPPRTAESNQHGHVRDGQVIGPDNVAAFVARIPLK